MSKSSSSIDRAKEEAEAFREAVKDAIPLPDKGRVLHPTPRPAPVPAQRMADDRKVLEDSLSDAPALEPDLESGDALAFLRQDQACGQCRINSTCMACARKRRANCLPTS